MKTESHIVTGIYASRAEAETVRSRLIEQGILRKHIKVVERVRAEDDNPQLADDDEVLKEVLIDGTVGTLVGTGLGALGQVALVAANVTLFVASPLLAPLAMLGWGAVLGGVVGAAAGANKGAKKRDGKFADLVHYAIRSGHVTLIVETPTATEKNLATKIIGDSLTVRDEQRVA
ncbi:hypothetical protein [Dechloromonas sp. A34]|uniref:hypothetical protein n=1 Tax=Dechloromonas sp. A34 TaxID=447588 RepID=UPI00224921AE|nr:hypothetical protein [Dechloromonas sp. A34]